MSDNIVQQDRESLSRSRNRIRQLQQASRASTGDVTASAGLIKNQFFGVLAGLKDLDGLQIFFLAVAALKDFIDFLLGLITFDAISFFDWIIDIPLLIFFIFVAVVLVLSNSSSIKTIIIGLFGMVGVSVIEISPLGILPAYLGFAAWLVSTINNSKKKVI